MTSLTVVLYCIDIYGKLKQASQPTGLAELNSSAPPDTNKNNNHTIKLLLTPPPIILPL